VNSDNGVDQFQFERKGIGIQNMLSLEPKNATVCLYIKSVKVGGYGYHRYVTNRAKKTITNTYIK
jgi:hypothetical protein